MLFILMFPITLLFSLFGWIFGLIGGLFGLIFSIAGGLLGLVLRLITWGGIVAGGIFLFKAIFGHRSSNSGDSEDSQENFKSFYADKSSRVE